ALEEPTDTNSTLCSLATLDPSSVVTNQAAATTESPADCRGILLRLYEDNYALLSYLPSRYKFAQDGDSSLRVSGPDGALQQMPPQLYQIPYDACKPAQDCGAPQ